MKYVTSLSGPSDPPFSLAGDLILMHWKNTLAGMCAKPSEICTKLAQFVDNNTLFMHTQYDESGGVDPYWYQVNLFTAQLLGLLKGYSSLGLESLSYDDLLYESLHVHEHILCTIYVCRGVGSVGVGAEGGAAGS